MGRLFVAEAASQDALLGYSRRKDQPGVLYTACVNDLYLQLATRIENGAVDDYVSVNSCLVDMKIPIAYRGDSLNVIIPENVVDLATNVESALRLRNAHLDLSRYDFIHSLFTLRQ